MLPHARPGKTASCGRPLRLRFLLNTCYSGPQAWFFLADDRGYFREEGLSVEFTEGDTLANAVPRLANGMFDAGFGDLNVLVEYASAHPGQAPVGVFALHNRSPYTIAVPAHGPIRTARDFSGRTLVAHPDDAAWRMFPEFCAASGIHPDNVRVEVSELPHRALVPMMLQGNWDGVFGFVNTIQAHAVEAGLDPARVLRHFEWRHQLPSLYGGALMVTPALRRDHPLAVQALVRAVNRGVAGTVADVGAAMDALVRRNPVINRASNHARLLGTLKLEMADAEGTLRGIGDADPARLARTIELMQRARKLAHPPTPDQLFDPRFLPPLAERVRSLARI